MFIFASASEEHAEHSVTLLDTIPYFFVSMAVFLLLAWVTWSYRDVANRHDHKSSDSKAHH
jgi:heme/copper-type cytochrome/quinol oxidase subunit 2